MSGALILPVVLACRAADPAATALPVRALAGPAGLSDLAIDPQGVLWAVSERPAALVRLEDPATRLPITGLPDGVEPEALAIGPDGTFWIGTEGRGDREQDGTYTLALSGSGAAATEPVPFPWAPWGRVASNNEGVEAMCAGVDRWAAGEPTFNQDGRRLAPLARWTGSSWEPHAVPLTTPHGKISALACDADGSLWAIERHYQDLALLHLSDLGAAVVTSTPCALPAWMRAIDANWEGLAIRGDTLLWISDNQTLVVTGPTRLAETERRCVPG